MSSIIRGIEKRPRACIIYGVEGCGKSTWASSAESAIVIPIEDGVADIDVAKFPKPETLDEFYNYLMEARDSDEFGTVVLDTLDAIEALIHKKVAADRGVISGGDRRERASGK